MASASSPELPELAPLLAREGAVAAVEALYGARALEPSGVVHVASAWDGPDGRRTIRITEASPKSAWDFFSLSLARARADAIVVTGAILRAEPALTYALDGALRAYREETLGKREPPELWVLTSGRGFDAAHPALHGFARPVVFAPEGARVEAGGVERRALPPGGLRALLAESRDERPGALVAIEAGPSTHRALYDAPALVDELLLTVYDGPLDDALVGGPMLDDDALASRLGPAITERLANEPAGAFRLRRYRRAA